MQWGVRSTREWAIDTLQLRCHNPPKSSSIQSKPCECGLNRTESKKCVNLCDYLVVLQLFEMGAPQVWCDLAMQERAQSRLTPWRPPEVRLGVTPPRVMIVDWLLDRLLLPIVPHKRSLTSRQKAESVRVRH